MKNKNILRWLGVFLIIWYLSTSNLFATQIEKTIDYGVIEAIMALGHGIPVLKAQLTFDPLPELYKTSTVHVKAQAVSDFLNLDFEWLVVTPYNNLIDFTQLTPSIWKAPIKKGDSYEGTFTITPTEVGPFFFVLVIKKLDFRKLRFYITIDESGKLVHLSKEVDSEHAQMIIHPHIIGNDVKLRYRVSKGIKDYIGNDFVNMFHISPLPSFNETSNVSFELTANRYCPQGVQFYLSGRNIEFLDLPNSWVGKVEKGQVHIDTFKIITRDNGCGWFRLEVRAHSTTEDKLAPTQFTHVARGDYPVIFFTNKDGELLYIGREEHPKITSGCEYDRPRGNKWMSQPNVFNETSLK